eukprot:14894049-Ditylum_brightwellii.AAC.1
MLLMGRPDSAAWTKSSHSSRSSCVWLVRGWGPRRQWRSKRRRRFRKCRLVGMMKPMWFSRPMSDLRSGWATRLARRISLM